MKHMIFGTLWTAGCLYLLVTSLDGAAPWQQAVFVLFPAFGLLMIWSGYRSWRRWRSLRIETVGGVTIFVWVEFDGTPCRSTEDPRPDWDAADGDGDGGGD